MKIIKELKKLTVFDWFKLLVIVTVLEVMHGFSYTYTAESLMYISGWIIPPLGMAPVGTVILYFFLICLEVVVFACAVVYLTISLVKDIGILSKQSAAFSFLLFVFVLLISVKSIHFFHVMSLEKIRRQYLAVHTPLITKLEHDYPIELGVKKYDFTKDFLFHVSRYSPFYNQSLLYPLSQIKNNTVIWQEKIEDEPEFPSIARKYFSFKFNQASSSGDLQVFTPDIDYGTLDLAPQFINNKIYKPKNIRTDSGEDIVFYDSITNKEDFRIKSESKNTQTSSILGVFDKNIILVRGKNREIAKDSYSSYNEIASFNLSTNKESLLIAEANGGDFTLNNGLLCNLKTDNSIDIYDIESGKKILSTKVDIKDIKKGTNITLLDCSKDHVVYLYRSGLENNSWIIKTHLSIFGKNGVITDKEILSNKSQYGSYRMSKNVVINDTLFYENDTNIYSKNLFNGKEQVVMLSEGVVDWVTDGNFIAYMKIDGEGKANLYLKKILKNI